MRHYFLLAILSANLACAQMVVSTGDAQALVHDSDPVITISSPCADPVNGQEECQTIVTRAQFDELCDALQPNMPLPQRLKVANAYARNLRMAVVAERRGLDKTGAFALEMHYARLQLLAQDLEQRLQSEAHHINDADLAAYYSAHKGDFETAILERIFIPHTGQTPDLSPEVMQQLAQEIRGRLIDGEPADQLQREVFARAKLPVASGSTRIEQVRRDTLPPNHGVVMDLATNQVQVVSDPNGAHFVYRMLEKTLPPLAQVKGDITKLIAAQRYRDSSREFAGNAVFSDAYFNPVPQAVTASARHNRVSGP